MTTDRDRQIAANNWNVMWIDHAIQYLEGAKSQLEVFETLGREASDMIDDCITKLECLKTDYKIEEE